MKKITTLFVIMLVCLTVVFANGSKEPTTTVKATSADAKESSMLQSLVASGALPKLEDRLPVVSDIMVETDKTPENLQYGGTLRRNNDGMWDYGPFCEEPLFRLTEDGGVTPNVAKSYDVSTDGLIWTIHLRKGMKWSDGEPFTAEDCVFYYNYMLITSVDNATGIVKSSYNGNYYNWYKSKDPADGIVKPAIITMIDDTTFQIKLYSPKPLLLQSMAIDNKWMFAPKHFYNGIVAYNSSKPHWSGISDVKALGGAGLKDTTETQAVANAKAKNSLYDFDNYAKLGDQLGYLYWQYAGRPTLRAWSITSSLNDQTLTFKRNPYFWKTDAQGRQLPYIDIVEMVKMDAKLYAQEIIAKNLDMAPVELSDFPTYKSGEKTGGYTVYTSPMPNWTCCSIELNQTYKDAQYADLFSKIDFRHALSIAADRNQLNEILFNGLAVIQQCAAPVGNSQHIQGATEKWTNYDPETANKLLDGITSISNTRNSDGYREFVDGANAGKAVTIILDTTATNNSSAAAALLAQYYKVIGIQLIESSNTSRPKRNEKIYTGDQVMAIYEELLNVFNASVRPDRLGSNRNISCWIGLYGQEHKTALTPTAGTEIAKVVDATNKLQTAKTTEATKMAGDQLLQSMYENTWIVGYLSNPYKYTAMSNKVKNFDSNFLSCDELRFYGNAKPYTWFIEK